MRARGIGGQLIVGSIATCITIFGATAYATPRQSAKPPVTLSAKVIDLGDTLTVSGTDCPPTGLGAGYIVEVPIKGSRAEFQNEPDTSVDGTWTASNPFTVEGGWVPGNYEVQARCFDSAYPHTPYPTAYFTIRDPNAATSTETQPKPAATAPPTTTTITEPEATTTSTSTSTSTTTTTTTTTPNASEVAAAPTGGRGSSNSMTGAAAVVGLGSAAALGLGVVLRRRRQQDGEAEIDIIELGEGP